MAILEHPNEGVSTSRPHHYGLTEADRADLHARLTSWFGDDRQAFLVSHLAPVVDRIKAEACAQAAAEFQWNALEMARKADQAERRAEEAEDEVERLRSVLAEVRRVFDLQCPPMPPEHYVDRGAWMAHLWWNTVLGSILNRAAACEWCGISAGAHANGCRLGLGPDERGAHVPACNCAPPYAECSHPPCDCTECVAECSGLCGEHHWLDRPESDTRECLICGTEVAG